jgi:hypothetical protein
MRARWDDLWRLVSVLTLSGLMACAHRVGVEIPAAPAVRLGADTFAVVADRQCRDVADALVRAINAEPGLAVDPRAPTRVKVMSCGRTVAADVDVRDDGSAERRRVTITGRAHALVVVSEGSAVEGHIVGAARHDDPGAWGDAGTVTGRSRVIDRLLLQDLADDQVNQLSPVSHLAWRRVHPNAPDGSARSLETSAVLAEIDGDLVRARRLLAQAHDAHPSPRTEAWLQELDARLQAAGLDTP